MTVLSASLWSFTLHVMSALCFSPVKFFVGVVGCRMNECMKCGGGMLVSWKSSYPLKANCNSILPMTLSRFEILSLLIPHHFVYEPSQWETLQCNVVSNWLGACTELSLSLMFVIIGSDNGLAPNWYQAIILTHWGRDKMAFSWMTMYGFWLKFH